MFGVDVISQNSRPSLQPNSSTLQATGMMALEKRSTITRRALHLFDVGNPVTMSMEMWVHGPTGTVFGLSGAASGCVLDFVR